MDQRFSVESHDTRDVVFAIALLRRNSHSTLDSVTSVSLETVFKWRLPTGSFAKRECSGKAQCVEFFREEEEEETLKYKRRR